MLQLKQRKQQLCLTICSARFGSTLTWFRAPKDTHGNFTAFYNNRFGVFCRVSFVLCVYGFYLNFYIYPWVLYHWMRAHTHTNTRSRTWIRFCFFIHTLAFLSGASFTRLFWITQAHTHFYTMRVKEIDVYKTRSISQFEIKNRPNQQKTNYFKSSTASATHPPSHQKIYSPQHHKKSKEKKEDGKFSMSACVSLSIYMYIDCMYYNKYMYATSKI